jgi:hypothetical protein
MAAYLYLIVLVLVVVGVFFAMRRNSNNKPIKVTSQKAQVVTKPVTKAVQIGKGILEKAQDAAEKVVSHQPKGAMWMYPFKVRRFGVSRKYRSRLMEPCSRNRLRKGFPLYM